MEDRESPAEKAGTAVAGEGRGPDEQHEYWDRVAWDKEFTLPLDLDLFSRHAPLDGPVLDYGCGYGRVMAMLRAFGYTDLTGLDSSPEMIRRARRQYPKFRFICHQRPAPPLSPGSFTAVIMFAVLTSIPGDRAQDELLATIHRLLRPGGVFYLCDYPLQGNDKNLKRYGQFQGIYGPYGTFRLEEGAVMRHHDPDRIKVMTAAFQKIAMSEIQVKTMNGSAARAFQFLGQKPVKAVRQPQ